MLRSVLASPAVLAMPLAAAGAAPPPETPAPLPAPSETFRRDALADPEITKAITQGVIDLSATGEIIVEGTTEKEIRNFVWRTITPVSGRKIAVRESPVCFGFDNITDELESLLRQRIAENLATIGRELAEPGCEVNAAVAFPRNAHAFMRWLSDKRPGVFGSMYRPEQRRHVRPRRVAYNWHFLPGVSTQREFQSAGGTLGDVWFQNLIGPPIFEPGYSRLSRQLGTEMISHSFTVIQASAIDGISPTQLADYLTMHALVMFEPGVRDEVPQGSILRLFDDKGANLAAAEEMSTVDRVVLSTLYRSGRSFFNAGLIRAEIARAAMKQEP